MFWYFQISGAVPEAVQLPPMEELDHKPPQPKPGPNQDYSDSSKYQYAGIRQQCVFINIVSRSKSVPKEGRGASKVVYNDETKIFFFSY